MTSDPYFKKNPMPDELSQTLPTNEWAAVAFLCAYLGRYMELRVTLDDFDLQELRDMRTAAKKILMEVEPRLNVAERRAYEQRSLL